MLDDQYELAVIAAVETDSNDRWELAAFTQYRARAGCSPSFFPDETALDFIPGSRMVERRAEPFPWTMGLTPEAGRIPGAVEITVGLSSLSPPYEELSGASELERWCRYGEIRVVEVTMKKERIN